MDNIISPLLPVYKRADVCMVRGEGVYLYDDADRPYLDFAAGIAVNSLGHCHPHLVHALKTQAETLWHCSNLYHTPQLDRFAKRLVAQSCADKVFFCSTGLEAVECGIKMVRRYHYTQGNPQRNRIITLEGAFHGRSLATIFAGGNKQIQEGYAPAVDGFDNVAFGDIEAVKAAITDQTAGILVEPVQGEGGVRALSREYLQELRAVCDTHGLLLFFDEIQCGMGRTGALFIYEQMGVTPDIIAVAKGIGSGFPLAACLANEKAASGMTPGSHGSTYGGSPLSTAVGDAVLDVMLQDGFMEHVVQMGQELKAGLDQIAEEFSTIIKQARGIGLMIGLVMHVSNSEFTVKLRQSGLLTAPASNNVIRLVPPLIIRSKHVEEALSIIRHCCGEIK